MLLWLLSSRHFLDAAFFFFCQVGFEGPGIWTYYLVQEDFQAPVTTRMAQITAPVYGGLVHDAPSDVLYMMVTKHRRFASQAHGPPYLRLDVFKVTLCGLGCATLERDGVSPVPCIA